MAFIIAPFSPPAQGAPVLTVEEAVRAALDNHPRLLAATRDATAAAAGVRSSRALASPNAFVAAGLTSVSGTGEELLFQQPLELNGTRSARTGVAQAQLRAARAQVIVSTGDIVFAAKSAYWELARAREQAVVACEALQVAQEIDRVARRQVEEGARPGIDLAQTGLEAARAQRQVTLADGQAEAAQAAFNAALGREPASPVGTLTPLSQTANTNPPAADLLDRALASRGEIQAERALGDQYRQTARLARAEGRPDLSPQVRVGYFTRGLQPAREGNGAGIGLTLTLPIFDYGERRGRIQQAEQSALAQEARVVAVQNAVRQQVVQAQARRRAAEEVVRAYENGVLAQAQRLLDGSRVGFREGRTSVVALLEAQRSFQATRTEYIDALADVALARAELERAAGAAPTPLSPSATKTRTIR